jgi:Protein of unknown function (DUF3489)
MATFTINSENNIAAHAAIPVGLTDAQAFASEKELAKLAATWPGPRLVEIWNSFAGVAPFDELKPVKRFTSRDTAVSRIWAAVQRLLPDGAEAARDGAAVKDKSKKSAARSSRRVTARMGGEDRGSKKVEVVAMLKRSKGATLAEIMKVTGWQAHTVRGFVSILGSKGAQRIESSKNSSGERSYRIAK